MQESEYAVLLRYDLSSFIHRCFEEVSSSGVYQHNWHIDLIASKLEQCRRGEIKRLIINIPPRYMKSICASVAFSAWLLGNDSTCQIICASYGQDLANKHARDTRTIIESSWYKQLFRTRLNPRKAAVDEFATTKGGMRMATSVGGVLTGRGGDFLIIDDPLKPDDAMSESQRNAANEWYDGTLYSRLNNKETGCIIIIMQRLHEDDLVGHALEQEAWETVFLPAIAEEPEEHFYTSWIGKHSKRREIGDLLHPERESRSVLDHLRSTMGQYHFSGQYQQSPAPLGGGIIKHEWLVFYEPDERPAVFEYIVQSWDTANKAGELNDFSVCTTWGVKAKRFYLLHVFRRRMDYPELKKAVREQAALHDARDVLIEDKVSGIQLNQELRAEGFYALKHCEPPTTDKAMRTYAHSVAFENGLVLLPKTAAWLQDYIHELTTFPACKHDDQVDSTTQALEWMRNRRVGFFDM